MKLLTIILNGMGHLTKIQITISFSDRSCYEWLSDGVVERTGSANGLATPIHVIQYKSSYMSFMEQRSAHRHDHVL